MPLKAAKTDEHLPPSPPSRRHNYHQHGHNQIQQQQQQQQQQMPLTSSASHSNVAQINNQEPRFLWLAKRAQWQLLDTAIQQLRKATDNSTSWQELSAKDQELGGMNVLMFAIKENRRAIVEALLEVGHVNINETSNDNTTALHLIVSSRITNGIIEKILRLGANASIIGGPLGQTPLHIACQRLATTLVTVRLLLRSMPSNGRLIADKPGNLPITYAVKIGHIAIVTELLNEFAQQQANAWRERKTGNSLLHLAINHRDEGMAKLLVGMGGANVNAANKSGRTPLHICIESGDERMANCLIANLKADYATVSDDGSSLMHLAAEHGHVGFVVALQKREIPLHMPNKAGVLPFHLAAKNGHIDLVRYLIGKGAPIDARTKDRYTAMHLAVLHNKPEVIQLLMGCGAKVSTQGGPRGEMPLHIAARTNSLECTKMLLLTGAQVNAPTVGKHAETPLAIAVRLGFGRLVALLLDEGADINVVSRGGESVLHLAVRNCYFDIVRQLVAHVKRKTSRKDAAKMVNLATNEGETALHLVCGLSPNNLHYPLEDVDIANFLLKYSADAHASTKFTLETPLHYCARIGNLNVALELERHLDYHFAPLANRQAKNGWTSLLAACNYGHADLVNLFTQKSARVDLFDEQGLSALHLAAKNGFIDCCELLLKKKAFINLKTKTGITPLHLAAANGFNKLVCLLVDKYKASVEVASMEKKTPLHFAAQNGHLDVAMSLVNRKANISALDSLGQTPFHLAAEYDHPDVVDMFLKRNPELVLIANQDGMTCAHIAAAKGSVAVIKELMRFNRNIVVSARNKTTESLPLHMAAERGHGDVVRILLDAGSPALSENIDGMTCVHLAAKEGHSKVLAALPPSLSWQLVSSKTGLTPLHVAVFYGKVDMVRELVANVVPDSPSAPTTSHHDTIKDKRLKSLIAVDYGLTPLHVACFAGTDQVVRFLLNLPGVDIEARSATLRMTPLHLASLTGSLVASSLLLSQSVSLLVIQDLRGLKPLHLCARYGHSDMVSSLISQGCDINVSDSQGWVPLHHAARYGQMNVVKLLLELGASVTSSTRDERIPLSLAASSGQTHVFMFLIEKEHNSAKLLQDERFVVDLMQCGRSTEQKAIEAFVLASESPLETAAQLSYLFFKFSATDSEHSKDLEMAGKFTEKMTSNLMGICSAITSPARVLRALDSSGKPFIDILVDDKLKMVVADGAVQRYLTEVWEGELGMSQMSLAALFLAFVFCPPVLFYCSLPLSHHQYHRVPMIKFMAYAASHIQFIVVLGSVAVVPLFPLTTREDFLPTWNEYLFLAWLGGNLTQELTNPSNGRGSRIVKALILALSAIAMTLQLLAITYPLDSYEASIYMYIRNQILSLPVMMSVFFILEILTFNPRFGSLTIILNYIIQELMIPISILMIFFIAWWLQLETIYTPVCPDLEPELTGGCICNVRVPPGCATPYTDENMDGVVPGCFSNEELLGGMTQPFILGILHGALFQHEDFMWHPVVRNTPEWLSSTLLTWHKACFHLVMVLILLTLVVSISAVTLERLIAKSDEEWRYERAKLIRNMIKTSPTPSPLNLLTKPFVYLSALIKRKRLLCTSYATYYVMLEEGLGDQMATEEDIAALSEDSIFQECLQWCRRRLLGNRIADWANKKRGVDKTDPLAPISERLRPQLERWADVARRKVTIRRRQDELLATRHIEPLQTIIDWQRVVERYREIEAEEDHDEYIELLGCKISQLEPWQLEMWEEAVEIEDDDERIMLQTWLVEEFNDVVKSS